MNTYYSPDLLYGYGYSGMTEAELESFFEQFLYRFLEVYLVLGVILLFCALVFYVFTSLSLYTMADRRGLSGAFLAWIPFLRVGMLGRVASDVHEQRTGKRALYGTFLILLMILPLLLWGIAAVEPRLSWVVLLSSLFSVISGFVMLFALSEIYRDYAKHWVGLLIFAATMPFLRPIFLLAIHKNIPMTVAAKRPVVPVTPPIVTPPPAAPAPAEAAAPAAAPAAESTPAAVSAEAPAWETPAPAENAAPSPTDNADAPKENDSQI